MLSTNGIECLCLIVAASTAISGFRVTKRKSLENCGINKLPGATDNRIERMNGRLQDRKVWGIEVL